MRLKKENYDALARLAEYADQLKSALEQDKTARMSEEGKAEASTEAEGDSSKVLYVGASPDDNFNAVLYKFQQDFYDSELVDSNYSHTIKRLGGGLSGYELAAAPSDCDVKLLLAVLTFFVRAERFVWGFWDDFENRENLVRVLFRLRSLVE